VYWSLDPKLALSFTLSRSKKEPVVELKLCHYELDGLIMDDEWMVALLQEDEEEDSDEEDSEGEDEEEEEGEATSSDDPSDATDLSPLPSLTNFDKIAVNPSTEPPTPLLPLPLSPNPTLHPSPPSTPIQTSTQNEPSPDPAQPPISSSDTSSPPQIIDQLHPPPTPTPELDGSLERREQRLLSILPLLDVDDDVEESSIASRTVELGVEGSEGGRVDRFWDNWVSLFELD